MDMPGEFMMLRTVAAVTAALFPAISAAPAFADCAADIPGVEAAVGKLKAGTDKTKAEGDIKLAHKYAGLKNEGKCTSYLNYAKKHVKM
jgi:hypothetical protein